MKLSDCPRRVAVATGLAALLSLVACAPLTWFSAASEPARPVEERHATALDSQVGQTRAMDHVRYLTNTIGPRLSSSRNYTKAARWARGQFEDWGLEVRLERFADFPVGFDRGPACGRVTRPLASGDAFEFVLSTAPWTPGTDGPRRAALVLAPVSLDDARARRDELAGAWILDRPGEPAPTERRRVIERAVVALGPAGFVRNGGEPMVVLGQAPLRWKDRATCVDVSVRRDQYRRVVKWLEAGEQVELEFDIDQHLRRGPIPQHNVVAELVGVEHPDEFVIVGAHLDSWDNATGAADNATGVATTMEAARLLAELDVRPRRTIRFVLFGAEEQGLLGSQGFLRRHASESEHTSAVLIHDMGANYVSGLPSYPGAHGDLREVTRALARLNATEMPFRLGRPRGLRGVGRSSDHASFLDAGIPAFFWKQSGHIDYERVHHTQYDLLEEVHPEYVEHSALVVAITALGLANLDHKLDRTGSEPTLCCRAWHVSPTCAACLSKARQFQP